MPEACRWRSLSANRFGAVPTLNAPPPVPSAREVGQMSRASQGGVSAERRDPSLQRYISPNSTRSVVSGVSDLSRLWDPSCGPELRFDPMVGRCQTFPQRDPWFPTEHLPESAVVAVSTPHPLRLGEIVAFGDA